jgi:hypothetical protein
MNCFDAAAGGYRRKAKRQLRTLYVALAASPNALSNADKFDSLGAAGLITFNQDCNSKSSTAIRSKGCPEWLNWVLIHHIKRQ